MKKYGGSLSNQSSIASVMVRPAPIVCSILARQAIGSDQTEKIFPALVNVMSKFKVIVIISGLNKTAFIGGKGRICRPFELGRKT